MSDRHPTAGAARAWVSDLYRAHGAALFRYALMILADREDAEDVVQQVFMSALRTKHEVAAPREYLRRATRNECYSVLRGRLRERTRRASEHELLELAGDSGDEAERLALSHALGSLPPEQREVVHLKVYEGCSFPEIAALVGISANTAASRFRYALERLRLALGISGEGEA
jgi:RNA polymerase sigma-70 factor (ECF subfamily)